MKINWFIACIVALASFHYCAMGYAGYDPSVETEDIMALALAFSFSLWVLGDAKKQKYHRPYEFGAFILFAWPIVLPAYLVATRGWKGLVVFSLFVFLYYFPWITGWGAFYLSH